MMKSIENILLLWEIRGKTFLRKKPAWVLFLVFANPGREQIKQPTIYTDAKSFLLA